jgi:hypothetical protein
MRGFVSEAFSWSVFQPVLSQCDFIVGDPFELAVFGKELAQQTVEIFVGAALPGGVRVVAKVEFHAGELFPRVGFIVTNLGTSNQAVVRFYNKRGTAEQWIKEAK